MSEFQTSNNPNGSEEQQEKSEIDIINELQNNDFLTPTWDPTSDFCFPVADIPVVNHIPCDLNWDHFTEINHFADGSNSNVFTAVMAGQTVVIKMIKETAQDDETAAKEFDNEHGILARIQHKNIIKVIGAGFMPRRFIVLEFLAGGSLNSLLQDTAEKQSNLPMKIFFKPTFTYANLLQKAYEMAEAFHHLQNGVHKSATVIHRDLKPDNIGFTSEGVLKLFDFGLVTCVKRRESSDVSYDMSGCTGSLRYMAPEVALKLPYTEKVDVYSYGILLWQMGRDRVPFKGMKKDDLMSGVVEGGERPKLNKHWPSGFCQLLTDCWDRDPDRRPTFDAILVELKRLINEDSGAGWGSSHRIPSLRRKSSWSEKEKHRLAGMDRSSVGVLPESTSSMSMPTSPNNVPTSPSQVQPLGRNHPAARGHPASRGQHPDQGKGHSSWF